MPQPDFSALTAAGGSFTYHQQFFCVDRVSAQEPGYFSYELKLDQLDQTVIGKAKCQPASLIRANLTDPDLAATTIDPLIIHLYAGKCHWIETVQILPAFRRQGHGSLWLECLCHMLQAEAVLPVALYPDALGDNSTALTDSQLEQWYKRHGFLDFPEASGLTRLRVRGDAHRSETVARIKRLGHEIGADLVQLQATWMTDEASSSQGLHNEFNPFA